MSKRERKVVKLSRLEIFGSQKAKQFKKTPEWEKEFINTLKFAKLLESLGKVHFEDGDFIEEIEDSPFFSVSECMKCSGRMSWKKMRKKIAKDFEEREKAGTRKKPKPGLLKFQRMVAKFSRERRMT